MNQLVIYPAAFGEPSASPFCVKALCMAKAAGIDFSIEETSDPRKAPKAKLPILKTSDGIIADSDQIRDHIEQSSGIDFDAGLTLEQRAISRALIRMVEEHTYFAIVCDRWGNDENWAHVRRIFFSGIPFPLFGIITRHVRKQALAGLVGQGMGRHTDAERFDRIKKDIIAVIEYVGDKPFLFGDHPTAADMSVIPILYAAMAAPVETDMSGFIKQNTKLRAYMQRGRDHIYTDTV
jgi:glutathione S-transferase